MPSVGLGWEGAQLAGRAAPLTGDRRAAAGLHAAARALHAVGDAGPVPDAGLDEPEPDTERDLDGGTGDETGPVRLTASSVGDGERVGFSERELEIGRQILAGLTYKQIGQRLFLSSKTVEHHVARMRQRSGAGSRDELFGLLRAALEDQAG
jgi:DNA-binding CsgD family transcriptional regulator